MTHCSRVVGMGLLWLGAIQFSQADPAVVMAAAPTGAQPFSFAVIGEAPFSFSEEPAVASVLRSIAATDVGFVIDVGDIKSPTEPCSDTLLENRKILFDESAKPLCNTEGRWVRPRRASFKIERFVLLGEFFVGPGTHARHA